MSAALDRLRATSDAAQPGDNVAETHAARAHLAYCMPEILAVVAEAERHALGQTSDLHSALWHLYERVDRVVR